MFMFPEQNLLAGHAQSFLNTHAADGNPVDSRHLCMREAEITE